MVYLIVSCAVIYGAILASFVTLVGYRVPLGMSVVHPASHCSECKRTLAPIDLIPVVSYLLNRGKCRGCGVKYGSFHVWMELLTSILFGMIAYSFYGDWLLMIGLLGYILYVNVMIVSLRVHGDGMKKLTGFVIVSLILLSCVHGYFLIPLTFVVVGYVLYPKVRIVYFMQYISVVVLFTYCVCELLS